MLTEDEARAIGHLLCSKHAGRCPDDCRTGISAGVWVLRQSVTTEIAKLDRNPPPTLDFESLRGDV